MRSAVRGWSPVMMMTRMPAACASRVATATSARGGSMMPTVPTQISRCSSPLCASGLSPASRGRYASPAFAAQRRPMHPRRSGCAAARRCRVQAWLTPHALSCIAPAARQAPFAITTEASSWSWSASMVDIILRADVNGIKGWRAGPRAPPPGPRQRQSAIGNRQEMDQRVLQLGQGTAPLGHRGTERNSLAPSRASLRVAAAAVRPRAMSVWQAAATSSTSATDGSFRTSRVDATASINPVTSGKGVFNGDAISIAGDRSRPTAPSPGPGQPGPVRSHGPGATPCASGARRRR